MQKRTGPKLASVRARRFPDWEAPCAVDEKTLTATDDSASLEAWVELMSRFEWEWFCTFTFRNEVTPEAADKAFRLLVSVLNRREYGVRWYKKGHGIQWVRALELQRRGVIHYHALFRLCGRLRRMEAVDLWWSLGFGIARIYAPRGQEAVRRYCAKYIAKDGELDVGGPAWGDVTQWLQLQLGGRHVFPLRGRGRKGAAPPARPDYNARDAMHRAEVVPFKETLLDRRSVPSSDRREPDERSEAEMGAAERSTDRKRSRATIQGRLFDALENLSGADLEMRLGDSQGKRNGRERKRERSGARAAVEFQRRMVPGRCEVPECEEASRYDVRIVAKERNARLREPEYGELCETHCSDLRERLAELRAAIDEGLTTDLAVRRVNRVLHDSPSGEVGSDPRGVEGLGVVAGSNGRS